MALLSQLLSASELQSELALVEVKVYTEYTALTASWHFRGCWVLLGNCFVVNVSVEPGQAPQVKYTSKPKGSRATGKHSSLPQALVDEWVTSVSSLNPLSAHLIAADWGDHMRAWEKKVIAYAVKWSKGQHHDALLTEASNFPTLTL